MILDMEISGSTIRVSCSVTAGPAIRVCSRRERRNRMRKLPLVEESKVGATWSFGFAITGLIALIIWDWLLR